MEGLIKAVFEAHATAAAAKIHAETGVKVRVVVVPMKVEMPGSVQEMMGVIARAMKLTTDDYYDGRVRKGTDLKSITVRLINSYYPEMTLVDIGVLLNNIHHTAVMYHRKRASNYLDTQEPVFTEKYNKSLEAVLKWIEG